jgi:hypothetical protein
MDILLACLHGATYLAVGLGLYLPAARRPACGIAVASAVIGLLAGALDAGPRELTTVHTYAGFDGAAQEVSMVSFPTGTASAAGWLWPLPFAAFAAGWVVVLLRLGHGQPRSFWWWPMLLAWTATAQWLGMQWLAAPAAVVQPLGLDRVLFPAGLALALLAARHANGLLSLLFLVSAGTVAARLPAALFSKLASDNRWGTCLDISSVRDIVNPMTGLQFHPRLQPGSAEQQFWLIWLEHIIMFPAVYMMSLTGIGIGAYMMHRHGGPERN